MPVTWSVRGVERETRDALEQAARQLGKTLGQYLNDEVRQFALGQAELEAASSAEQVRVLKEQVQHLRELVENLAALLGTRPEAPAQPPRT
ncbi:hypothetical protein D3Y59_06450 [Hymenobacter oligotrophus]|uniref:Uncharacterized protein n=1 Tax=Hymenobacter oligotrophus TaxID=2319843 RepID=A0A3B7RRE3_9BACT|nr:hypothetical protein [Hymenobacter oligotrophus]AYA36727.1 hypothetical protein D3Y59_06450 [Hymenobacter oligotrophus]